MLKMLLLILWKLFVIAVVIFAVTFVIYFFNLDMKLTALMEKFMLPLYDKVKRDQHL